MNDKEMFILIFSGVWSLLGIIFLTVSAVISASQKRKAKVCTAKAIGTVTDVVSYSAGNPHYSNYHPVVQYTTDAGETITKKSDVVNMSL